MQLLIDAVIKSYSSDNIPTSHKSPLGYANSAVFFTPYQLAQLIQFLKEIRVRVFAILIATAKESLLMNVGLFYPFQLFSLVLAMALLTSDCSNKRIYVRNIP